MAFRTPFGNFYYTVMPFGLKNASFMYQREIMDIFYDMLHYNLEDYVDDIIVKSRSKEDHDSDLRVVFKRC